MVLKLDFYSKGRLLLQRNRKSGLFKEARKGHHAQNCSKYLKPLDHADFVSNHADFFSFQNLKNINYFKPIFLHQKNVFCKTGDDKLLEIV